MSKYFCANGVRIGAFISTRNAELHAAMRAVSKFAWWLSLADQAWQGLLEDEGWLDGYLERLRIGLSRAYELCTGLLGEMGVTYMPS